MKIMPSKYASVWLRIVSFVIDVVLINIIHFSLGFILATLTFILLKLEFQTSSTIAGIGTVVYSSLTIFFYFVVFPYHNNGQSLGQSIVKIKIVNQDFGKAGFVQIFVRNIFGNIASILATGLMGIGLYLMIVDEKKRGINDRLAKTLVVHDENKENGTSEKHHPPLRLLLTMSLSLVLIPFIVLALLSIGKDPVSLNFAETITNRIQELTPLRAGTTSNLSSYLSTDLYSSKNYSFSSNSILNLEDYRAHNLLLDRDGTEATFKTSGGVSNLSKVANDMIKATVSYTFRFNGQNQGEFKEDLYFKQLPGTDNNYYWYLDTIKNRLYSVNYDRLKNISNLPKGKLLFTRQNGLYILDLRTGTETFVKTPEADGYLDNSGISVSGDKTKIVYGFITNDGKQSFYFYDLKTNTLKPLGFLNTDRPQQVVVSPNGERVIGYFENILRAYDIKDGKIIYENLKAVNSAELAVWSPDSNSFVFSTTDKNVVVRLINKTPAEKPLNNYYSNWRWLTDTTLYLELNDPGKMTMTAYVYNVLTGGLNQTALTRETKTEGLTDSQICGLFPRSFLDNIKKFRPYFCPDISLSPLGKSTFSAFSLGTDGDYSIYFTDRKNPGSLHWITKGRFLGWIEN